MSEQATSFLVFPAKCMHLCARLHRRFQCITVHQQLLSIQDAADVDNFHLAGASVLVTGWDTSLPGASSALLLFLGPGPPGSLREKFGRGAVLGPFAPSQLPFLSVAKPRVVHESINLFLVSAKVKEEGRAAAMRSTEIGLGAVASSPHTQTHSRCSQAVNGSTAAELAEQAATYSQSEHPRFASSLQPRKEPHASLVRLDITRGASPAQASGALLVTIKRRDALVAHTPQLESARPGANAAAQVSRSVEKPTERPAASHIELPRPVEFQFKSAKWVSAMQPFVNMGADQQHTFHFGAPPWYSQV